MAIRQWFDKNIEGGIDNYLQEVNKDIEAIDKSETRAKVRIDFIKVIEQVLGTLDHLNAETEQRIAFNLEEIQRDEIDEHWNEDT